jgi:hypothetical protein
VAHAYRAEREGATSAVCVHARVRGSPPLSALAQDQLGLFLHTSIVPRILMLRQPCYAHFFNRPIALCDASSEPNPRKAVMGRLCALRLIGPRKRCDLARAPMRSGFRGPRLQHMHPLARSRVVGVLQHIDQHPAHSIDRALNRAWSTS